MRQAPLVTQLTGQLGQVVGEQDRLRLGDGADELGHVVPQLLHERLGRFRAGPQDHERAHGLTRGGIRRADHRGLGHRVVVDERALDLGGGDVVPAHEHDVVDAPEQPEVAVVVALGAVTREVQAREPRPVGLAVPLRVTPDAAQHRRPRSVQHEVPAARDAHRGPVVPDEIGRAHV